jgi:tRNA threonylcarbamoyl adenosine modification protein YeaZ
VSGPGESGARLLAAQQWTLPGQALRVLVPAIRQALDTLGATPADLSLLAAARGPGSFTGIRLVLSALAGLAAGTGAPTAGFAYLPLLARAAAPLAPASGPATVLVLTHARSRLAHVQAFALSPPDGARPLAPVQALTYEAAADLARSLSRSLSLDCSLARPAAWSLELSGGAPLFLVGSALRRDPAFFAALAAEIPGAAVLPPAWDHPGPDLLLSAARTADEPLTPFYLRPCDAEENLASLVAPRGLTEEEARDRLAGYSAAQ